MQELGGSLLYLLVSAHVHSQSQVHRLLGIGCGCAWYIYVLLKLVQFLDRLGGKENWMSSPTFVFSLIGLISVLFVGFLAWRSRSGRKASQEKKERQAQLAVEYPVFG